MRQRLNFNWTAFSKNFKTDNVRLQGMGQDCACCGSKQPEAYFVLDLVREFSWTASGLKAGTKQFKQGLRV